MIDFIDYQIATRETDAYPTDHGLALKALGLAGEAGEVANKVKKIYRDDQFYEGTDRIYEQTRCEIFDELGDVLWYVAQVADELGFNLKEIAQANLDKLASRKERGVLHGSGDLR